MNQHVIYKQQFGADNDEYMQTLAAAVNDSVVWLALEEELARQQSLQKSFEDTLDTMAFSQEYLDADELSDAEEGFIRGYDSWSNTMT